MSIDIGTGLSVIEYQEYAWLKTLLGKNASQGFNHAIVGKHLGRYRGGFSYRSNGWFELFLIMALLAKKVFPVMAGGSSA